MKLLAALVGLAVSQLSNKCPKVELKQNFDPNMYLGTWYEMQRSANNNF